MKKQLVTCLFLLITAVTFAQQKTRLNLVKSDQGNYTKVNGVELGKVYGGIFVQQYSTLRSDSAYMHPASNTFEAFGHVIITQGDTLHIYADNMTYDDNTKIAVLTNHVKMVDRDAVLTTNFFTYNTATKIGTYTNGGKLVSKDNVLTSQNGYYFAGTRDAYFRYNVVMTTPDALIKTDTLRYNSGTRITYFYGPTHIYGKKDKDTLYTENGTYNTKTEQAFFGKKNRYSQGTKSLKGDSLFYDKLKGYGKAIKNITFEDTEQRMILKGDLGEYFKADDRAIVTINPYVIFITEDKDTTKTDTTKKVVTLSSKKDSIGTAIKNTLTDAKTAGITLPPAPKSLPGAKADSMAKVIAAMPAVKNAMPLVNAQLKDSSKVMAAVKAAIPKGNIKAPPVKDIKQAINNAKLPGDTAYIAKSLKALKDTAAPPAKVKRDTMYIGADTLQTQIVTYKVLKDLQAQRRLAAARRDTSYKPRKPFVPDTKQPKFLTANGAPALIIPLPDYIGRQLFDLPVIPKPLLDSIKKKTIIIKATPKKVVLKDSLLTKVKIDTTLKVKELSDTARIRILSAHHNVHIFKSDLQGKSDSLFYSSSDSVIRSYVKPMYWSQGAQLSGDTIHLQLKNKKADNMDVFPSAFVVQIENGDSTHFNQMGGKRLRVYFKDSKISQTVVTGNAETIYFDREKGKVTKMHRSISNRITANFKKGELANVAFVTKNRHDFTPNSKVKEDDRLLKGFIWKPKDRPANKEAVIHPKKPVPEREIPAKGSDKNSGKKPVGKIAAKDSTSIKVPLTKPLSLLKKDSTAKSDSLKKLPELKLRKDTVKTVVKS